MFHGVDLSVIGLSLSRSVWGFYDLKVRNPEEEDLDPPAHYIYIINIICLDVTATSADDFNTTDDLYDAVGALLHEATENENEDEIKQICTGIVNLLKK